jgi:hypothetical protein
MGYTIARVNERGLSRNKKAVREQNAVLGFIENYRRTTSRTVCAMEGESSTPPRSMKSPVLQELKEEGMLVLYR